MIYKHNGSIITDIGGKWLTHTPPLPPLGPNTIRVKFSSGYTPTMGDSQTLVDSSNNIWDIYKESNDWTGLFVSCYNLLEVLGANTSNITDIRSMFFACRNLTKVALFDTSSVTVTSSMFTECYALTSVPLFDTSNVKRMNYMFENCTSLRTIPLFNTSKVVSMTCMFDRCINVESGALALYQQASTQTNPVTSHLAAFYNCGSNTVTGAAELAQIPDDWKVRS